MTIKKHDQYVRMISEKVKDFYKLKKKLRIYHGSTNSTRNQNFKKDEIIDISILNRVLSINTKGKYAIVEPNVPMDALVKETLKHGLIPPVVMEFPGITVGGGIQGGAGESSSFRYGAFHDTFTEYEMVIPNGEIVKASKNNNSDLFYGTAGSYGTLGIITQARLRLIPTKKYVQLEYLRVKSPQEATDLTIKKTLDKNVDFIDGILFSKKLGTIMVGRLTDTSSIPLETFSKPMDEWFYIHAKKITENNDYWKETIPIEEYLFRYDRGAFWMGEHIMRRFHIPFNRMMRFLHHRLFKTRTLFRILQSFNLSQGYLLQDLCVPRENYLRLLDYLDKETGIYPIWILPIKPDDKANKRLTKIDTEMIMDAGVWGKIKSNKDFVKINREVEEVTSRLDGIKILYAQSYYTKKEFWGSYNKKLYDSLRKKHHSEHLPDIYEKTVVKEKYKPSMISGIINFISSPRKLPLTK